ELKTAVLLKLDKAGAELVLADGQNVTLKGAAARPLQTTKRGSELRVLESGAGNWQLSQVPQAEGAVVTLDPATGAIRAL
ncbi:hypothetical protein ABTK30_20580, partial [Acinetobacter baumannii]